MLTLRGMRSYWGLLSTPQGKIWIVDAYIFKLIGFLSSSSQQVRVDDRVEIVDRLIGEQKLAEAAKRVETIEAAARAAHDDTELARRVGVGRPARETCDDLVAAANRSGGADNITAVLARFGG